MTIKPFQSSIIPIGHFDFLDTELSNVQGGEVVVFDTVPVTSQDFASQDVFNSTNRTLLRLATTADVGPFFFAYVSDKQRYGNGVEGTSLFARNKSFSHNYDSSGKIAIFATDGFYSVSSLVVDTDNIDENTPVYTRLYVDPSGKISSVPSVSGAIVGFFVEYRSGVALRSKKFETIGSHTDGDTIIIYKTSSDGYFNVNLLDSLVNDNRIGLPTTGDYSDGYFGFTSETTIADALDAVNEQLALLSSPSWQGIIYADNNGVGVGTNSPTSTMHINGSIASAIQTVSDDYVAGSSDHVILANASATNITVTLPLASQCVGRQYNIKKIDSTGNEVIIGTSGSDKIDGLSTKTMLVQYQNLTVVSNGSNWFII